jgi:hypothetical protein
MGTNYFVVCQDCQKFFTTGDDWIEGKDFAEDLLAEAENLAEIYELFQKSHLYFELRINDYNIRIENLKFFSAHRGHNLVVMNEYSIPYEIRYSSDDVEQEPEPEEPVFKLKPKKSRFVGGYIFRKCPDCHKPEIIFGFRVGNHQICIPF